MPRYWIRSTSSVGKVVDNARIQSLPLNTRNMYSLIYLTPGVTGGIGNSHNQVGYSVNGIRGGLMETLVDGSSAAFPTVNGFHGISVFPVRGCGAGIQGAGWQLQRRVRPQPGQRAEPRLQVRRRTRSTERPTSSTGIRQFDANTYFNKQRGIPLADFSRSQFGGMTGGPIARDRTFFMVLYEGTAAEQLSRAADDGADGP